MNKHLLAALLGVLAGSFVSTTQASDAWEPGTTHFTLDYALAAGGDKLVTVQFSNGDSSTIHGGDGLFVDGGVQRNFVGGFSFKGTLGVKYWGVRASNNDTTFTRYPLDLLGIYTIGRSHFGFGVTHEFSPSLDQGSFGGTVNFNDANGFILQYQYWMFGVRYTNIHYTADCALCSGKVDGSSIGVFFNYVF